MKCINLLVILSILLLLTLGLIVFFGKSSFGEMCTYDNRQYPEGKLPQSLTETEKKNLALTPFILNNKFNST